jgi:putative transposase
MGPAREHATHNHQTYMVTSETWGRRTLFQVDRWAELLVQTISSYRDEGYFLHKFVVMPDHFHILLTPKVTLERAIQYIKGGLSFRAKKELGSNMEAWQKGFQDHRIRSFEDYVVHVRYIRENPVNAGLCSKVQDYLWSSAHAGVELDAMPQGLKPLPLESPYGAAEAAPLQSSSDDEIVGASKARPLQGKVLVGDEAAPLQSKVSAGAEAVPLQSKALVGAKAAPVQYIRNNKI